MQFENQTLYDKDLTLTQARQSTYTKDMKDNTNTTSDLHINREVNNEINDELIAHTKWKTAKQTQIRWTMWYKHWNVI